jgi:hypothetical protein
VAAVSWAMALPLSIQTFSRLIRPSRNSQTCSSRWEILLPWPRTPKKFPGSVRRSHGGCEMQAAD